ncbi:hypothetical protein TWF506_009277 [Arthrobotrys conoides]|uniref:Uncharacterized protein n=1 Tax=Arthrobotrys conoides TaxID=74498 RepID=A0AAN8N4Q4_9PEZI
MKIWAIAYTALISISSISYVAEAQRLFPHNNINKLLLKEIERSKVHINGHVSVQAAKGKDGSVVLPDKKPIFPTKHQLLTSVSHAGARNDEHFNQTYWVYDKHYKKGGPIFLYLNGETSITDTIASAFLDSSRIHDLQKKFGGLGIILEHRYYGESTPRSAWVANSAEVDEYTPAEKFKYLTTDLALKDVKFFADNFNYTSERVPAGIDLTGRGAPWVVLGGSYAGSMASLLRKFYPDTFFAAYSSSAPIEAQTAMPAYWDVVARVIRSEEPACFENMRSAIKYIDQELAKGGQSAAVMKIMFLGPGAEINTNGWLAEALMFHFYDFQTAGLDEPIIDETVWSIRNFCDHMNTDGDDKSPIGGWENAANSTLRRSASWSARQWATWPGFIALVQSWGYSCTGFGTAKGPGSCKLASPTRYPDYISWSWQYCSEWGYFQLGNPGPDQITSNFSNLEHWKSKCNLQFRDPTAQIYIRPSSKPSTNATNKAFGGRTDPQPRTFYTMGENDPWSVLGFLKTKHVKGLFNAPGYNANSTVPACDHRPSGNDLFGLVIPNGIHSADIATTEWSKETFPVFTAAMEAWLPCFETHRERVQVHRQQAIPKTLQRFGANETNQTFTLNPKKIPKKVTPPFVTGNETKKIQGKNNSTLLEKISQLAATEKSSRLERRAKLWSD